MLDEAVRADLARAARAAREAARAADALVGCASELDVERARLGRHALFGLRHSAQDGLAHAVALVGSLDGPAARAAARAALSSRVPHPDADLDVPRQLVQIEAACTVLADTLAALAARERLALAPDAPAHPRFEDTAALAAGQLEALARQIPRAIARLAATEGLRRQAVLLEDELLARLQGAHEQPPRPGPGGGRRG